VKHLKGLMSLGNLKIPLCQC